MSDDSSRKNLEYTLDESLNLILLNLRGQKFVLIVEGDDDKNFYRRNLELEEWNFYIHVAKYCDYSKGRAIELARCNQSIADFCTIVDADHDRILNLEPKDSNIILTDNHDLELDIIISGTLQKIVDLKVAKNLVENLTKNTRDLQEFILDKSKILGKLRYVNMKEKWFCRFRKLNYGKDGKINLFFERKMFISEDECIKKILSHKCKSSPNIKLKNVKKKLNEYAEFLDNQDKLQLCHGKDVIQIFVYYLNKNLRGHRKEEININSVYLAYEKQFITYTKLYTKFNKWFKKVR